MLRQPAFSLLGSLAILALLPAVFAQSTCNATSKCPSSAPCCSEYGYCGTESYCLGGCEPMYSYSLTSCKPDPICKSQVSTFYNLDKVWLNGTTYTGNASAYDWVVDSGQLIATDYGTRLILNETNGGTKISSTRYVHYGTIDFVLETSKWAGVVTAAITMSDVKDEIDWEFPGTNTTAAQTNFWFLGVANYSATQGLSVGVSSDASSNFHTYTIDWQPDTLTWKIDGSVVRTVNKVDTLSSDGTQYQYPSTPSQIQISIWPAGINTSAQGTIDWAGGLIDWTDSDYVSNGYFWNTIQSVNITCNSEGNQTSSTTGWAYTGVDEHEVPIVAVTNASTSLSAGRRTKDISFSWTGGLLAGAGSVLAGYALL